MKAFIIILMTSFSLNGFAQATPPPCGFDFGTSGDESNISIQMRYGSIADAISAINQAKNSRGTALGCAQISYSYSPANITEPLLADIVNIWNTAHSPQISSTAINCPRIGRYENNSALGAYYAMLAGYYSDTSKLAEIANMMYDQQYAQWNISNPIPRNEGVYAYLNVLSNNPCYPGGVVGSSVSSVCSSLPAYCVTYSSGQFSGINFLTSDQDDANNWFDGGLTYDHGWVGVQMIESALQQNDPILKEKYRKSVALASQFCISEYAVKNHNYTAKLIWLLAQMYAWTGNTIYSNELNYKLDKNLIPGILWDSNTDGLVDGTSPPISFASLTPVAQIPGRMWDGHNSLPWYHAMNAWALLEAYVAFRDLGDVTRANELKPYVIGMVDNLANEIINNGVVTPNQLGVRDITYCLLSAIWKLSKYENESHLNWEDAAWAMWNTGYFNTYSTHTVCVGLYLLIKSETHYVPLHLRESFVLSSTNPDSQKKLKVFPNPTNNIINLYDVDNEFSDYTIYSLSGQILLKGKLINGTIDASSLNTGIYMIAVKNKIIGKLIKT